MAFSALLLLLALIGSLGFGQTARADATAVEISKIPASEALPLGHFLQIWEAPEGTEDAAVIAGQKDSEFAPSAVDTPGKGFVKNAVWVRWEIVNRGATTEELLLESRYPLLDIITLWAPDRSGAMQSQTQGDTVAVDRSQRTYRSPVFELAIHPGKNVYYLKVTTQSSCILALYLWQPEAFMRYFAFDMVVLGLFFGIMVALLLYNIFLSFSFRSRSYSLYSAFLATMIVTQLSMQGIWPYLVPSRAAIWLQNNGFLINACSTYFTAILVTRYFLNMRQQMPRLFRFCQLMLVINILVMGLGFVLEYAAYVKVNTAFLVIGTLVLLGSSLLAVARGYRPAYFYLLAWVALLCSNVLLFLNYEGITHNPLFMQFGNFPAAVCEGILMSLALGDRVNYIRARADRLIQNLNQELQDHLTRVERVVSERTETIRTILDNVASGFIMIDAQGLIAPGFTRSCQGLLGTSFHEGDRFTDVLGLDESGKKFWRLAIDQIFTDILPLNVALGQLPPRADVHGKYLQFFAAGIRDQAGTLKNILITITDASELRRKKIEARRNRHLLQTLGDIEGFRQFIGYSYTAIENLKKTTNKRDASFILHTLKGNCLVFHMRDFANHLHRLEEKKDLTHRDFEVLEDNFQRYLSKHEKILRTSWGPPLQEKRVTDEQLHALVSLARGTDLPQLQKDVLVWVDQVTAKTIGNQLQAMINDARVLAKKLKKSIQITVEDHDARVRSEHEDRLIEVLIHVVRNAVVHGIEDDRDAVGKPAQGHIHLEAREKASGLIISCRDDGRGFDRKVWEAGFREKYPLGPENPTNLTLAELVRRVSHGGFSTQKEVSLIAGRGVGVEALFAAAEACRGQVLLESEQGKGCLFVVFIPRQQNLKMAS